MENQSNLYPTDIHIYIHIIFAVKGKENLITSDHRDELHRYITRILQKQGHKTLAVFCMPDHTHILMDMSPDISMVDLDTHFKKNTTDFINESSWVKGKFEWQEGFGAFSCSSNDIDKIVKYILHQETHHRKETFKQEFIDFLENHQIEYDEKDLFDWIE